MCVCEYIYTKTRNPKAETRDQDATWAQLPGVLTVALEGSSVFDGTPEPEIPNPTPLKTKAGTRNHKP